MAWTLDQVKAKLVEIKNKGFQSIPPNMYRHDEGVVGQLLEREFGITENNLSVRDLGTFELKGIRMKSQTLTLCHKKPDIGLTPIEIFNRFGYERPSRRDTAVIKKKLFTTVKGKRANNLNLILKPNGNTAIEMYFQNQFICKWDLIDQLKKIDQIILVFADTKGATGSRTESFHYVKAWLLNGLKRLEELIDNEVVVIDFCIDQAISGDRGPHDRGPHIRIPMRKLQSGYKSIRVILE